MEKCDINIPDNQTELLKEFRRKISDIWTPDYTDGILIRYLRVKNFNLKQAEMNYRQNDCNRKMFRLYNILEHYKIPEVAEKYDSEGFLGFAKDGTPIRYRSAGGTDLEGLIMSMCVYELCMRYTYFIEQDIVRQKEESKRREKEINQTSYILDFETFRIQQVAHKSVIELGLDFARLVQDFYPERWGNIFVVNPPYYFELAFNIFKPMMNDILLEKIHIISKDRTGEFLLKYIDEDVLPEFLGGKRVDSNGDPRCSEFINYGGIIPEKYYSRNRVPLLMPSDSGVDVVMIRPRSVYNHITIVKEEGLKMRLIFRTENGSIRFSFLYRDFGSDPNILDIPGKNEILDENDERSRVKIISANITAQSHLTQTNSPANLLWPGIYIMRFDNTGSWFSPRKLFLKVIFPA